MQKVGFLPITEFAPDSVEWDTPLLEECKGLLPLYGGWRAVKVHKEQAKQVLSNDSIVTGSHAHLITAGQLDEILVPSSLDEQSIGTYLILDDIADVGGSIPDDNSFLKFRQSTSLGAEDLWLVLSDPINAVDGTATWTLYIRFKTTSGMTNWTLDAKWQEFDGGAWNDVDSIAQQTGSTGQTTWQTITKDTANPAPTDADDLRIVVSLDSSDSFDYSYYAPTADNDVNGAWVNEAAGTELFSKVDDAYTTASPWGAGADATYIQSPSVESGKKDTENFIILQLPFHEDLSNEESAATFGTVWSLLRLRAKHTGASDDFKIWTDLVDIRDNKPVFTDGPWENTITSSFANYAGTALGTAREFDDEEVRSNLGVKLWVENVDVAETSESDNYPTATVSNAGGWTWNGGSLHGSLGDNSNRITLTEDEKGKAFVVNFGALTEPADHTKTKVFVQCKVDSRAGDPGLKVTDSNGTAGVLGAFDVNGTSNYVWKKFTLSEADSKLLNWGGAIHLKFETRKDTGRDTVYEIRRAYLQLPGTTPTAQISAIASQAPGCEGFDISWGAVKSIADTTATPTIGDLNRVFFGTRTKMHMWDENDVTQFADVVPLAAPVAYGSGTYPMSWDFASFGGDVYMTNFADRPVKWSPASPGVLSVSHTAGDVVSDIKTFKYKFVESIGDHLVIANVNHDDYEAYTVCFSHFNDPTSFSAGDVGNQSDFQNLTSTPGEITGLVGGEYGLIFKRNAIYRMSYVGPDIIFRFDLISRTIGTPYGKSIVKVGPDVYFYNTSGFYVMKNGGYPIRIGDGKISKYLTDTLYSDNPVALQTSVLTTANDNNIIGTYDNTSGIIFWLYRSINDDVDEENAKWENEHIVFYNPTEDRWGRVDFTELQDAKEHNEEIVEVATHTLQHIVSLLNSGVDNNALTRGVILFTLYDTATDEIWVQALRSNTSSAYTIKTKRLSPRSLRDEPNKRVTIGAIRPYLHGEPVASYDPSVTITVSSYATPTTNTTEDTSVVTKESIGDDGWYELTPIVCEYFDIQMEVEPDATVSGVKDISGFEIRYIPDGEY
jgi:hypothetical protein